MRSPFLFLLVALFFVACQSAPEAPPAEEPAPVDTEQVQQEIEAALDAFIEAFKNKDIAAMSALLADDGLFCGTDPGELWGKEDLVATFEEMAATEELQIDFTVDTRKVRVAEDGQSALALEQMVIGFISPHVPTRQVYHFVKSGDGWLMDFSSAALIPVNEDLAKINAAYE